MLKFKPTSYSYSYEITISKLADQLISTKNWQLLNTQISNLNGKCLIKCRCNNKIYQLVDVNKNRQNYMNQQLDENIIEQQVCRNGNGQMDDEIFLDVIKISDCFYLSQKAVGNLKSKICMWRQGLASQIFNEQQIVNTFMPILEALALNKIPSFYQINPDNIVIDCSQNIRLKSYKNTKTNFPNININTNNQHANNYNHCQQIAISILQIITLCKRQDIINLLYLENVIIKLLMQTKYSHKIIGLIIILLNQGKVNLAITFKQFMESGRFQGDLFKQFINSIMKIYPCKIDNNNDTNNTNNKVQTKQKLLQNKQQNSQSKTIRKKAINRDDIETEDSQYQTIAKYRSGNRIIHYKNINQSLQKQMVRKDRIKRALPN